MYKQKAGQQMSRKSRADALLYARVG